MEAKHDLDPSLKFEIFTKVPRWFFDQSLTGAFEYHSFLKEGDFRNGRWLSFLRKLLAFPRINRQGPRGAEQVALFVLDLLDSSLP